MSIQPPLNFNPGIQPPFCESEVSNKALLQRVKTSTFPTKHVIFCSPSSSSSSPSLSPYLPISLSPSLSLPFPHFSLPHSFDSRDGKIETWPLPLAGRVHVVHHRFVVIVVFFCGQLVVSFILFFMIVAAQGNSCDSQPCQHGGSCVITSSGYQCVCAHGTFGTNCQTIVTTCSTSAGPCENNGKCIQTSGAVMCDCPSGYFGASCELSQLLYFV